MYPLEVVIDGRQKYYIGGERLRGRVIYDSKRDGDAGRVIVTFSGCVSTMVWSSPNYNEKWLFKRELKLFHDAFSARKYEWPFEFIFPTRVDSGDSSAAPLNSTSVDPSAERLPPSITVLKFVGSNSCRCYIEYRIKARLESPLFTRPILSSNPVDLDYIPPREEDTPDPTPVPSSKLMDIETLRLNHNRGLSVKERFKSKLQIGQFPKITIRVTLHFPTKLIPGTSPSIFASLEFVPEMSTTDNHPVVELKDITIFFRAETRVQAGEGLQYSSFEKPAISTNLTPRPISWQGPEPVAQILLEPAGLGGSVKPIIPNFSFGNVQRTHELMLRATVCCLDITHSLSFGLSTVHIFSPHSESELDNETTVAPPELLLSTDPTTGPGTGLDMSREAPPPYEP